LSHVFHDFLHSYLASPKGPIFGLYFLQKLFVSNIYPNFFHTDSTFSLPAFQPSNFDRRSSSISSNLVPTFSTFPTERVIESLVSSVFTKKWKPTWLEWERKHFHLERKREFLYAELNSKAREHVPNSNTLFSLVVFCVCRDFTLTYSLEEVDVFEIDTEGQRNNDNKNVGDLIINR